MLFSLFHAKFVRAAGIITPDLPVFDDQLIGKKKRQVMAPGEMEQVILKKKKLEEYPETKKIMIRIEEA